MTKAEELLKECQMLLMDIHAGTVITDEESKAQYELQNKIDEYLSGPTYEEVLKAWEELGYTVAEYDEYYDFEVSKRVDHIEYAISISDCDYAKVFVNHSHPNKLGGGKYITYEEHEAINLTIRYKKAQEDKQ